MVAIFLIEKVIVDAKDSDPSFGLAENHATPHRDN